MAPFTDHCGDKLGYSTGALAGCLPLLGDGGPPARRPDDNAVVKGISKTGAREGGAQEGSGGLRMAEEG